MVKSKEMFEKFKQLKDQGKTVAEITREIDISKGIAYKISSAIKHNCSSIQEYCDHIIKNIINPETGKNFLNEKVYNNYIAKKRGFKNQSSYVQFRKLERCQEELSEQEKFERSIGSYSLEELERKIPDNRNILDDRDFELEIENKDNLDLLLNKIPDRYRKVLEMRYLDGKTQEEIADLFSISYVRVQQIEKRAFEYFLTGKRIRDHKTLNIGDGELLLVHILSKSIEYDNESELKLVTQISNLTNEIYHYNQKTRSSLIIQEILYNRYYKKRTKDLKEKYFPLS